MGRVRPLGQAHTAGVPFVEEDGGGARKGRAHLGYRLQVLGVAHQEQGGNASQQMGAAMRELARIANYIVLDLGVALPLSLQGVLKQCEKVILVVEPDLHTMVHTKGMLQDLDILGVGKNKLICTMVNRVRTELAMSAADVQKSLGVPLDVVFTPAPELAHQAARVKQAMVATEPQSFTAQQVMKLVSLLTESVPAKA